MSDQKKKAESESDFSSDSEMESSVSSASKEKEIRKSKSRSRSKSKSKVENPNLSQLKEKKRIESMQEFESNKAKMYEAFHQHAIDKASTIKKMFKYTNEDNPFGDMNLSKDFIWKKKIEQLIDEGKNFDYSKEELLKKHQDLIEEIHKVKQRRAERQKEKEQLDQQKFLQTQEREDQMFLE